MHTQNKSRPAGTGTASKKTTDTRNLTLFTPRLHRLITIVRHVLITLPFECAMLVTCLIVLAGMLS